MARFAGLAEDASVGRSPEGAERRWRRIGTAPDYTAIPYTDADSSALLDEAVRSLVILRNGSPRDPGARLSVLVSLLADAEARLADSVWLARTRDGYSWDRIAERMALTADAVRHRYGGYVRACSELP
jgi:hypothetical protein